MFAGINKLKLLSSNTIYYFSLIETFRFQDEHDKEYEIFSVLRSGRARTNVILAGKRGSCGHSPTSFSENVEVTETSYQMLEVLSFCVRERV